MPDPKCLKVGDLVRFTALPDEWSRPGFWVHRESVTFMMSGSGDRYNQRDAAATGNGKLVPEGVEGRVPYKGPLAPFLYQLVGGLRAGMGYCGTQTLEELRTRARFIQVSPASVQESHPHDILITQEAPNYSSRAEHNGSERD